MSLQQLLNSLNEIEKHLKTTSKSRIIQFNSEKKTLEEIKKIKQLLTNESCTR